jgi:hypothetical protein
LRSRPEAVAGSRRPPSPKVVLRTKRAVSEAAAVNFPCSRLLAKVTGYSALLKKLLTLVCTNRGVTCR